MEQLNNGTMEQWNNGKGKRGKREKCNIVIIQHWNNRTMEQWNCNSVTMAQWKMEQWNCNNGTMAL